MHLYSHDNKTVSTLHARYLGRCRYHNRNLWFWNFPSLLRRKTSFTLFLIKTCYASSSSRDWKDYMVSNEAFSQTLGSVLISMNMNGERPSLYQCRSRGVVIHATFFCQIVSCELHWRRFICALLDYRYEIQKGWKKRLFPPLTPLFVPFQCCHYSELFFPAFQHHLTLIISCGCLCWVSFCSDSFLFLFFVCLNVCYLLSRWCEKKSCKIAALKASREITRRMIIIATCSMAFSRV